MSPCSLECAFGSFPFASGGDEGVRTPDPLRARQVLSQLSYTPIFTARVSILSFPFSKFRVLSRTLKIKQCFHTSAFRFSHTFALSRLPLSLVLKLSLPKTVELRLSRLARVSIERR